MLHVECDNELCKTLNMMHIFLKTQKVFSAHLTLLEHALAMAFLSARLSNECFVTKRNNSLAAYQLSMIEGFF